jgi:hypothetical protein
VHWLLLAPSTIAKRRCRERQTSKGRDVPGDLSLHGPDVVSTKWGWPPAGMQGSHEKQHHLESGSHRSSLRLCGSLQWARHAAFKASLDRSSHRAFPVMGYSPQSSHALRGRRLLCRPLPKPHRSERIAGERLDRVQLGFSLDPSRCPHGPIHVRGDEQVPEHGVGLAVVNDLVASHDGELTLGRSDLGGGRVEIMLRAA